jgi:hypothetical protein
MFFTLIIELLSETMANKSCRTHSSGIKFNCWEKVCAPAPLQRWFHVRFLYYKSVTFAPMSENAMVHTHTRGVTDQSTLEILLVLDIINTAELRSFYVLFLCMQFRFKVNEKL